MKESTNKKGKIIRIIITLIAVVLIISVAITLWYFKVKKPHDEAVIKFSNAANQVAELNSKLQREIDSAQDILDSDAVPYDESTINNLTVAISDANTAKRAIPDMPKKTADINSKADALLEPLDYSSAIADINDKKSAFERSVVQMLQITNPSGDFIIQRLQGIDGISGCQAVTEDHDPNGNLNKQGGYTATIYFSSPLINQEEVYGGDIVDKGTECGGAVEVYATKEDAEKRNTYLSSFDGAGALNSGSHAVLGTIVIRTSTRLTATQQNDLTQRISDKLVEVQ